MAWTTTTTRATGYTVTAAVWNAEIVDNMQHLEQVGLVGTSSSVVVDVTSAATSTLIISLGAITYTTELYLLRFECAGVQRTEVATGSPTTIFGLYDGAASSPVSRLGQVQAPGTSPLTVPVSRNYYFFPGSAGSHTYQIRAYNNSADSWTYVAGASGGDVAMPISISVYKVPGA